jgi:hypothetical protein
MGSRKIELDIFGAGKKHVKNVVESRRKYLKFKESDFIFIDYPNYKRPHLGFKEL